MEVQDTHVNPKRVSRRDLSWTFTVGCWSTAQHFVVQLIPRNQPVIWIRLRKKAYLYLDSIFCSNQIQLVSNILHPKTWMSWGFFVWRHNVHIISLTPVPPNCTHMLVVKNVSSHLYLDSSLTSSCLGVSTYLLPTKVPRKNFPRMASLQQGPIKTYWSGAPQVEVDGRPRADRYKNGVIHNPYI